MFITAPSPPEDDGSSSGEPVSVSESAVQRGQRSEGVSDICQET